MINTVGGQKLVFYPHSVELNKAENISEILIKLDDAAKLTKKKAVVVMDEFQQLSNIQNHAIEASIRHAMQYSRNISYIFSGSNRHMLMGIFNNKNRPFYNACEIMKLDRISVEDYDLFIQHAAKTQWGKFLPKAVLEEIFKLSQLHPSYINRICGHFWLMDEFPTQESIGYYWHNFVESKRAEFAEDILSLSMNQKKILVYLAHKPTIHPGSHEVCTAVGLSEPSIRQAIRKLMLKDYLYKDKKNTIRVLDPAFKDYIKSLANYLT